MLIQSNKVQEMWKFKRAPIKCQTNVDPIKSGEICKEKILDTQICIQTDRSSRVRGSFDSIKNGETWKKIMNTQICIQTDRSSKVRGCWHLRDEDRNHKHQEKREKKRENMVQQKHEQWSWLHSQLIHTENEIE